MRCPRCDGSLVTFAVEGTGESAVVCESCGFAGVPASHRTDRIDGESWERAIRRFDETRLPPERTCRTGRAERVTPPGDEGGPDIDPERLEESVSVAASLRESGESDGPGKDS
jgi:hypothetical protein